VADWTADEVHKLVTNLKNDASSCGFMVTADFHDTSVNLMFGSINSRDKYASNIEKLVEFLDSLWGDGGTIMPLDWAEMYPNRPFRIIRNYFRGTEDECITAWIV